MMVFLLAHGGRYENDDLFAGSDSQLMSVKHDLLRPILANNETLKGKPKVTEN